MQRSVTHIQCSGCDSRGVFLFHRMFIVSCCKTVKQTSRHCIDNYNVLWVSGAWPRIVLIEVVLSGPDSLLSVWIQGQKHIDPMDVSILFWWKQGQKTCFVTAFHMCLHILPCLTFTSCVLPLWLFSDVTIQCLFMQIL